MASNTENTGNLYVDIIVNLDKYIKELKKVEKYSTGEAKKMAQSMRKEFEGAFKDYSKTTKTVKKANKNIEKSINELKTNVLGDKFEKEQLKIKNTYRKNVDELKSMYNKMLKSETDYIKRSKIKNKFKEDVQAFKGKMNKDLNDSIDRSRKKVSFFSRMMGKEFNKMGDNVGYLSTRLWRFGDHFTTGILGTVPPQIAAIATAIIGLGNAIATTVSKGIEEFRKFEATLSSVSTLLSNPEEQIAGLGEALDKLAVKHGRSIDELGGALENILGSGMLGEGATTEELEMFLDLTTKASVGMKANAKDIMDSALKIAGAYGVNVKNAQDYQHILDVLARTEQLGQFKNRMKELGTYLPNVALSAKQAGLSMEQLGAVFAGMTGPMTSSAKIATGLRGVLDRLATATAQKKIKSILGYDIRDENGKLKDFMEIMGEVKTRVLSVSKATKTGVDVLLGDIFSAKKGKQGAMAILESYDQILYKQKELQNSYGTVDKANALMTNNSIHRAKIREQEEASALRKVGSAWNGIVEDLQIVGHEITLLFYKFVEYIPNIESLIMGLGSTIAGFMVGGPVGAFIGLLSGTAFGGFIASLTDNDKAIKQFHSSISELGREIDTLKSYETQSEMVENLSQRYMSLTESLKGLKEGTSEYKITQSELDTVTRQLTEISPELADAYADQMGSIEGLNNETKDYLETLNQLKLEQQEAIGEKVEFTLATGTEGIEAGFDQYMEAYAKYLEAKKTGDNEDKQNAWKNYQERKKIYEGSIKDIQQLTTILGKNPELMSKYGNDVNKLLQDSQNYFKEVRKQAQEGQLEFLQGGLLQDYSGIQGAITEMVVGTDEGIGKITKKIDFLGNSFERMSGKVKDDIYGNIAYPFEDAVGKVQDAVLTATEATEVFKDASTGNFAKAIDFLKNKFQVGANEANTILASISEGARIGSNGIIQYIDKAANISTAKINQMVIQINKSLSSIQKRAMALFQKITGVDIVGVTAESIAKAQLELGKIKPESPMIPPGGVSPTPTDGKGKKKEEDKKSKREEQLEKQLADLKSQQQQKKTDAQWLEEANKSMEKQYEAQRKYEEERTKKLEAHYKEMESLQGKFNNKIYDKLTLDIRGAEKEYREERKKATDLTDLEHAFQKFALKVNNIFMERIIELVEASKILKEENIRNIDILVNQNSKLKEELTLLDRVTDLYRKNLELQLKANNAAGQAIKQQYLGWKQLDQFIKQGYKTSSVGQWGGSPLRKSVSKRTWKEFTMTQVIETDIDRVAKDADTIISATSKVIKAFNELPDTKKTQSTIQRFVSSLSDVQEQLLVAQRFAKKVDDKPLEQEVRNMIETINIKVSDALRNVVQSGEFKTTYNEIAELMTEDITDTLKRGSKLSTWQVKSMKQFVKDTAGSFKEAKNFISAMIDQNKTIRDTVILSIKGTLDVPMAVDKMSSGDLAEKYLTVLREAQGEINRTRDKIMKYYTDDLGMSLKEAEKMLKKTSEVKRYGEINWNNYIRKVLSNFGKPEAAVRKGLKDYLERFWKAITTQMTVQLMVTKGKEQYTDIERFINEYSNTLDDILRKGIKNIENKYISEEIERSKKLKTDLRDYLHEYKSSYIKGIDEINDFRDKEERAYWELRSRLSQEAFNKQKHQEFALVTEYLKKFTDFTKQILVNEMGTALGTALAVQLKNLQSEDFSLMFKVDFETGAIGISEEAKKKGLDKLANEILDQVSLMEENIIRGKQRGLSRKKYEKEYGAYEKSLKNIRDNITATAVLSGLTKQYNDIIEKQNELMTLNKKAVAQGFLSPTEMKRLEELNNMREDIGQGLSDLREQAGSVYESLAKRYLESKSTFETVTTKPGASEDEKKKAQEDMENAKNRMTKMGELMSKMENAQYEGHKETLEMMEQLDEGYYQRAVDRSKQKLEDVNRSVVNDYGTEWDKFLYEVSDKVEKVDKQFRDMINYSGELAIAQIMQDWYSEQKQSSKDLLENYDKAKKKLDELTEKKKKFAKTGDYTEDEGRRLETQIADAKNTLRKFEKETTNYFMRNAEYQKIAIGIISTKMRMEELIRMGFTEDSKEYKELLNLIEQLRKAHPKLALKIEGKYELERENQPDIPTKEEAEREMKRQKAFEEIRGNADVINNSMIELDQAIRGGILSFENLRKAGDATANVLTSLSRLTDMIDKLGKSVDDVGEGASKLSKNLGATAQGISTGFAVAGLLDTGIGMLSGRSTKEEREEQKRLEEERRKAVTQYGKTRLDLLYKIKESEIDIVSLQEMLKVETGLTTQQYVELEGNLRNIVEGVLERQKQVEELINSIIEERINIYKRLINISQFNQEYSKKLYEEYKKEFGDFINFIKDNEDVLSTFGLDFDFLYDVNWDQFGKWFIDNYTKILDVVTGINESSIDEMTTTWGKELTKLVGDVKDILATTLSWGGWWEDDKSLQQFLSEFGVDIESLMKGELKGIEGAMAAIDAQVQGLMKSYGISQEEAWVKLDPAFKKLYDILVTMKDIRTNIDAIPETWDEFSKALEESGKTAEEIESLFHSIVTMSYNKYRIEKELGLVLDNENEAIDKQLEMLNQALDIYYARFGVSKDLYETEQQSLKALLQASGYNNNIIDLIRERNRLQEEYNGMLDDTLKFLYKIKDQTMQALIADLERLEVLKGMNAARNYEERKVSLLQKIVAQLKALGYDQTYIDSVLKYLAEFIEGTGGGGVMPGQGTAVTSYESGTERVPKTGLYTLHKDEAVLNKEQAELFRKANRIPNLTIEPLSEKSKSGSIVGMLTNILEGIELQNSNGMLRDVLRSVINTNQSSINIESLNAEMPNIRTINDLKSWLYDMFSSDPKTKRLIGGIK